MHWHVTPKSKRSSHQKTGCWSFCKCCPSKTSLFW